MVNKLGSLLIVSIIRDVQLTCATAHAFVVKAKEVRKVARKEERKDHMEKEKAEDHTEKERNKRLYSIFK